MYLEIRTMDKVRKSNNFEFYTALKERFRFHLKQSIVIAHAAILTTVMGDLYQVVVNKLFVGSRVV
jgi:hypothetical protein